MPFGYHGCYLRIDVSTGSAERVPLADDVLRQYIGGSGLGVRLLLDEGRRTADPLAPEAPLIFAFSPLVGSPLTTSAKFAVVSKSPLTERINDSLASSGFAIAGKRCGCDAIVIVGRAPELSVLVIDDGRRAARSRPAMCAATPVPATEEKLRARLGATFGSRRSVRPASGWCATPPSRTTAVMPVAAAAAPCWAQEHQGDRRARHAARRVGAPARADELSRDLSKRSFGPATAKYRELGTATNLLTFNRFGALPTRNFQSGTFDGGGAVCRPSS